MTAGGNILELLKSGSSDEIGKAITDLARLKDPGHQASLRMLMGGPDPYLAAMAAYALGESGDPSGMEFMQKVLQSAPAAFQTSELSSKLNSLLEEIHKYHDTIDNAYSLSNRSYYIPAKEKLLEVLQVYSSEIPKLNVPHFDQLVGFSVKKSRGLTLDALSVCEFSLGNIDEALHYNMEAVTLGQETGDPQLLKLAYADLGCIHISLGNYYSALELLHQSLDIDDSTHDPWRKRNRTISSLAQLYFSIGQSEKALDYAVEALELAEKENDINGAARAQNSVGVLLCGSREFTEARSFLENALNLAGHDLKDKAFQGLVLHNMAYMCMGLSELDRARECLQEAMSLSVEMSDKSTEALSHGSLSVVELESGNVDEAYEHAEKALSLSRRIEDASNQIDALSILATIESLAFEEDEKAYGFYEEALSLSETLRKNLMLDDFKMSFAGNHAWLYQQMVSLCVRTGRTEEAFEYIERSKSRALVDMLASATDKIAPKELSPAEVEKVAALKIKLDILRKQMCQRKSGDEDAASESRQDKAIVEIAEIEREYNKTFGKIKIKDPEWASLSTVEAISIGELQTILDPGSLFFDFHQAADQTVIVAVKRECPAVIYRIPIDLNEEAENVFQLFSALSEGKNTDMRSHEYIKKIKQPLAHFYELIIKPLAHSLDGINHIIFSPHQFWHYLPFSALYDNETKQYLIDTYSISFAPSATVLAQCRKRGQQTPNKERVKNALILANSTNDLPYAEEEGRTISSKFSSASLFVREEASYDKLLEHGDVDVIHIACHGYFRGDSPLLSHLILTDSKGEQSPYFLPDLFNLRFNASLATLSACETGVSQVMTGDELMGITRTFMYAGASSLLTTLWTINDKSTSLMMDRFYDGLMTGTEGKAVALQMAIQDLKSRREYSHPWYWASFQMTGEWF